MSTGIDERDRSTEGHGRTALVTGASSGIGYALAELLAAKGYTVLPLGRRRDRLEDLAEHLRTRWGIEAEAFAADLGDPDTPRRVLASVTQSGHAIDVLVNNAGDSRIGRYEQLPWTTHATRIQLMSIATMELCHGVLPGMVEHGWGRIINTGSIASLFTGFPTDITYNTTKGMIERFTEALDSEYRTLGIRCTVSLPGPTPTEIFTKPGSAADVAEHPLFRHLQTSTATVARQTYAAVMNGKPFIVPGYQYKPLAVMLQYAPRPIRRRLSRALCKVMAD